MSDLPFVAAFDRLPAGTIKGQLRGRRWIATKTERAGGKAASLVAEEQGGRGYVSFNLYRLGRVDRLKPCEMPESRVRDFILNFVPD